MVIQGPNLYSTYTFFFNFKNISKGLFTIQRDFSEVVFNWLFDFTLILFKLAYLLGLLDARYHLMGNKDINCSPKLSVLFFNISPLNYPTKCSYNLAVILDSK